MAEIRTALRAYLVEGHPLPDVMPLLNELLVSMGRHRSATVAILELDFESGTLEAVSAGHLPALIVGPDGEASFLEPFQGLPLGVRRGGDYRSRAPPLRRPEACSLLYTDGLVERRGESIDVGLDRLRAAARRAARERGRLVRGPRLPRAGRGRRSAGGRRRAARDRVADARARGRDDARGASRVRSPPCAARSGAG